MTPTEPRSNFVSCILGPYRLPMAVMYVDLDHFVRICIDVPAEDVFVVIEKFQRIVADTVSSFKGEINAYQGDGVLATFSNLAGPGCATRTLKCAWKILERIRALDLDQAIGGEQEISASIGLQYGQVWTGTIGISKRFGPTLVGDAVNVAVRLEQQAHAFDAKIVVGDELMQMARREHAPNALDLAQFADAGPLLIRGRRTPINVWALQAEAGEALLESAATAPVGVGTALYPNDRSVQS
jgi:adenylate cyclase